jgi:hypothetical protein
VSLGFGENCRTNYTGQTFNFSQVVDDRGALDQVLDSVGHVDGQVDGGAVEPDPEDAVEEADAHAEELDHQHDDEGCECRVKCVLGSML